MAEAFLLESNLAQSRVYFDSLNLLSLKHPKDPGVSINIMTTELAYADFYLQKKQPDLAYVYILRANHIDRKLLGDIDRIQLDLMTGKMLVEQKEYAKALPLLESSATVGYEIGPEVYLSLLQTLSLCYSRLNRWQDAYLTLERYVPLRDSLYLESSKKSIADAEGKYQNKAKQQQIDEQKSELEFVRKQRLWLTAAALMFILIAALLIVIYRNKQKSAANLNAKNIELGRVIVALEEANKTKAKLFGILSHDLRSPISQVYQFLKLQKLNPGLLTEIQKKELSHKIETATASLLETMEELLVWSKTQMNSFNFDIRPVEVFSLVKNSLNLLQLNIEANQTIIENAIPEDLIIQTDEYFLQTILRNLLQNAIKASGENGEIHISYQEESSGSAIVIANTGNEFSQDDYESALVMDLLHQGLNGLGLKLVDELSVRIGARVSFSRLNSRTLATILFPN
ncbi:Adaptive-response sensory-kinase SasA [Dyadobacter sp. CECT 9275]|uniref:histidine kinase n=1 Tax=Dyadobacter helix TaxID=2822344 RepID=A0A916JIT1_9BACT|nr:HAMP domain-containing sensor histidine kinase [Dyadobacter sp. CECT 9275]CAG5016842.1 Adaptive-response sensory-kinase SasA [Dyadobacter sp. CECT 9275]